MNGATTVCVIGALAALGLLGVVLALAIRDKRDPRRDVREWNEGDRK